MTLLYFAWVRQAVGTAEEEIALPPDVRDVQGLIAHLSDGDVRYAVLADAARIRVAVNQAHAKLDAPLSDSDEVAFFPPVTGG